MIAKLTAGNPTKRGLDRHVCLRTPCWPCRCSDVGAARATARDGRVVALAPGSTLLAAESENGREHPNWYRGKVIRIYVEETDGDGTYETYERHRETRDN